MKVMVLFETIEGQTGKIAQFVSQEVEKLGHTAVRFDCATPDTLDFSDIDAIILAAPVHERRHPKTFEATLVANKTEIAALPSLMLTVSLSAAFPEGREEAMDYLVEMNMRTGLTPTDHCLVAGAVRSDKYDYFASQILRHVVLRDRSFDPDGGDSEFTDWDEIARKISRFLAKK